MKTERSGFGGFVEELRRRRVVRVALGYLAGAFVILQLGEIILPAFSASDAGLRILVVVCALGFPVAVVLGWIYDITPAGIRRTEALEGSRGGKPRGGDATSSRPSRRHVGDSGLRGVVVARDERRGG